MGDGRVAEWFKAPVLKTGVANPHRGFESRLFRQELKMKTRPSPGFCKRRNGTPDRSRTCDTWYRKPVLYPLSYGCLR